jgi:hypothetical protein
MTTDLTEYERDLLRYLAGLPNTIKGWGAAMSVAIEYLHGQKLVSRERTAEGIRYVITDAGYAALAEKEPTT